MHSSYGSFVELEETVGHMGNQCFDSTDTVISSLKDDLDRTFYVPNALEAHSSADSPGFLQNERNDNDYSLLVPEVQNFSQLWKQLSYLNASNLSDDIRDMFPQQSFGARSWPCGQPNDVHWCLDPATSGLCDTLSFPTLPSLLPSGFSASSESPMVEDCTALHGLFQQLPPTRSAPLYAEYDPTLHQQDPRFDGDLYTASWVRGEGAERAGWCGYCSSWLKLKDSAYWVCLDKSHSGDLSGRAH